MNKRMLMVVLTTWLTACGPPPPPNPLPPPSPADGGPFTSDICKRSATADASATLGSGANVYRDVEDNSVMVWESGPQGGHHIWLGVRMTGLRRAGTITELTVSDLQNPAMPQILSRRRVPFTYDGDEGGFCVLKNLRIQLDEDVDIHSLQDHHLLLEVTLTDPDGATAEARRFVVVQGPLDQG